VRTVESGQLRGAFKGFKDRDTYFEFTGGGKWRQAVYNYHYYYAYMPDARVLEDRGAYLIEINGMGDTVEVTQVR
jgi:uncharacterized protein YjlB